MSEKDIFPACLNLTLIDGVCKTCDFDEDE